MTMKYMVACAITVRTTVESLNVLMLRQVHQTVMTNAEISVRVRMNGFLKRDHR